MQVPLFGFQQGDTIGLLIMVDENEKIRDLAIKLQKAASIRVEPTMIVEVVFRSNIINPEQTVAQSGLTALDRFDLCQKGEMNNDFQKSD